MDRVKIGNIVTRKSYGNDTYFKVVDKKDTEQECEFILKGINCRLQVTALEEDLLVCEKPDLEYNNARVKTKFSFKKLAFLLSKVFSPVFSFIRKAFDIKMKGKRH